jgi:hypothetical protein
VARRAHCCFALIGLGAAAVVLVHCGTFEGSAEAPTADAAVEQPSQPVDAGLADGETGPAAVDAGQTGRACAWLARGSTSACAPPCLKTEFATLGKANVTDHLYTFAPSSMATRCTRLRLRIAMATLRGACRLGL